MPRTMKTPNWKTAPALHDLMEQATALYQDAWKGETTSHSEVTFLVDLSMRAFLALGVSAEEVRHAAVTAGLWNEPQAPRPPVAPPPVHEVAQAAKEPVVAEQKKPGGLGGIFKG
jgi:hypothetical protein